MPHGRDAQGHWHYHYKLAFLGEPAAHRVAAWLGEWRPPRPRRRRRTFAATDTDVFHPDAFRRSADPGVVGAGTGRPRPTSYAAGLVDVDAAGCGAHTGPALHVVGPRASAARKQPRHAPRSHLAADHELSGHLEHDVDRSRGTRSERPSDHAALLADFVLPVRGATGAPHRTAH